MVFARVHTPSWRQGFARHRHRSAYRGLWLPALGPTGSTLRDVGGRGNHGTLTSMDPATDWATTGKRGLPYALDFDGSANYVNCGNNSSLAMVDEYSYGGWLYRTSTGRATPWGKNYTEYDFFMDATANNRIVAYFGDSGGFSTIIWNSTPNLLNAWHHIIITGKKSTGDHRLWIDGVDYGIQSGTPRPLGGVESSNFTMGRRSNGTNWFGGRIGAAYVCDRVLAANEIQALYRDPMGMVRRRAMMVAEAAGVAGPYSVAAGLPYVAGSAAGDMYATGSAAGDVYTTGSAAGTVA